MAIYEKPVKLLFKDMIEELGINKGEVVNRDQVFAWFKDKYPRIKAGTISAHFLKMSINAPSRVHYNVSSNGDDDLLFQIDAHRFRLYDSSSDPEPIYEKRQGDENGIGTAEPPEETLKASAFAYEKDLQNFLSKNLHQIESGLKLYEEEDITGIEFPVGSRCIDILSLDKDNNYVVIELKVSRGHDRVVGQLLRYMAWIRKNHADVGQHVRGAIIAREISEDLLLACSEVPNIALYEYQLSVSLKRINQK